MITFTSRKLGDSMLLTAPVVACGTKIISDSWLLMASDGDPYFLTDSDATADSWVSEGSGLAERLSETDCDLDGLNLSYI